MDLKSIFILFIIGCILIFISIVLSSLSSKIGIPVLFMFLCLGILSGTYGIGRIQFNNYPLANIISNLSLAIIILDGGMRTKRSIFKIALYPALSLATIGIILTMLYTGMIVVILFHLKFIEGLLVGAIIASTDAAAIFSLSSSVGLNERVTSTVEMESCSNDPMAVFLTTTFIQMIKNKQYNLNIILFIKHFLQQFILGIILGYIAAWILKKIINRIILAHGLYPLLVLSIGIFVFSLTLLLDGSSILSVYLYGFIIGNSNICGRNRIIQTFDGLAWLSQIIMFIILGLLVNPQDLICIAIPSLILSLCMIFFVRPLSVFISLMIFHRFNFVEKCSISWMGLRGAVPIILAVFPIMSGISHALLFFNISFFIVLISLIIQGCTLNLFVIIAKITVPIITTPIHRLGFDIQMHNKTQLEQYIYIITSDQWCVGKAIRDLYMPHNTFITILFRYNEIIRPTGHTILKSNDIICIIGHEHNLQDLGKLFSKSITVLNNQKFFGDFIIDASSNIKDIANIYGLHLDQIINQKQSISEFLTCLMNKIPIVGDKIEWQNILWTIAEKKQNKITKIGIRNIKNNKL
ncbi:potassium/proton antiporter [Enterobacteriaceae endosymbiont of Macroplea mutica]|uniref:potassium/proton antiporter n=1 Tax=Enterobacteriaceae endosymbiont of Macroplea mutica TaxID=2675791 RepID=UPI00144914AC|nr:potassium/proton antiporter [Enterobacteriaceae endosymbiont of Macroplea mutica]QJC31129.1 potassium/proton antiporter [Enterobacteriaceae endosymbiont of Macroplea mutica]